MSPLPIPGPASSPVSQIPHLACVPPPGPQESSCSLDCLCSQQSLPSGGNKMTERLFPAPQGFPGGSEGKESACNAGDLGLIPGLGRCPGEGKGCPLHYSCLENSMDRGAWWATVRGVAKSLTRLREHLQLDSKTKTNKQKKITHFKNRQKTSKNIFPKQYASCQKGHEKVLSIINHQRNANQSHDEISFTPVETAIIKRTTA